MIKLGFFIGTKVVLARRVTHEFGPSKFRKDVPKGYATSIKGMAGGKPVVRLEAMVGKKTFGADVSLKLECLALPAKAKAEHDSDSDDKADDVGKNKKVFKKYPWLEVKSGDNATLRVEVIPAWQKRLMDTDTYVIHKRVESKVGMVLQSLRNSFPTLGPDDIMICTRGDSYELYTLKEFKAGSLVLTPDSTEIKPRFWTANRGAICRGTEKLLGGKDRRPLVLDGRVRSSIAEDKTFALFWVVGRTEEAKKANLVIDYVKVTGEVQVSLKTLADKLSHEIKDDDLPEIPVLINPKKIAKHTLLLAEYDLGLKALMEQNAKDATKEKEKKEAEKKEAEKVKAEPSSKKPKKDPE